MQRQQTKMPGLRATFAKRMSRAGQKSSFMIMDTVDDFDFDRDMIRLAALPRQAEWEAFVAKAQGADPSLPSHKKWRLMEKIFELDK